MKRVLRQENGIVTYDLVPNYGRPTEMTEMRGHREVTRLPINKHTCT